MFYPLNPGERCLHKAFTLIELLTVIAIIGVLAGITFGVVKGVKQRAAISRAVSEMGAIAATLDTYKRQYGDYPQTANSTQAEPDAAPALGAVTTDYAQAKLFNALAGKLGPRMAAMNGKVFLTFTQFSLETQNLPDPANNDEVANALLDPWGRRYIYYYKDHTAPNAWGQPSYILISAGPDGLLGLTINNSGQENVTDAAQAADNVYYNR